MSARGRRPTHSRVELPAVLSAVSRSRRPVVARSVGCSAVLIAVLVAVALAPAAARAQAQTVDAEPRRHAVALLVLLDLPADGPVSEVYGSHPGLAGRYSFRASELLSIAGDLSYRGPGGETASFGLEADLEVVQFAAMLRYHPPLGLSPDALDLWLGGGLVVQSIEERVGFPDGPLQDEDSGAGWAVGAGVARHLGDNWGVLADVRFSRLSISSGLEGVDDAELGGLELLGGVFVSF